MKLTIKRISNKYLVSVDRGTEGFSQGFPARTDERILDTFDDLVQWLKWNFGLVQVVKPEDKSDGQKLIKDNEVQSWLRCPRCHKDFMITAG